MGSRLTRSSRLVQPIPTEHLALPLMIFLGRQRKQAEKLASEIFGKSRRASTLQAGASKPGGPPSLASRISKASPPASIAKLRLTIIQASQRSASASPNLRNRAHANGSVARPRGPLAQSAQLGNASRAHTGPGLTIRGLAGPCVVVASNFAPGTTSADIQSAVDNAGLPMESCRVITSYPTVIAELMFVDKPGAENCIANFNNRKVSNTGSFAWHSLSFERKADGRLLHVYLKQGGPTPVVPARAAAPPAPERPQAREVIPQVARDQRPRDTDARRADPEFQDGSYGFESRNEPIDVDMEVDEADYEVRLDDYRNDRYNERPRDRRDYEPRYRASDRDTRADYRPQEKSRPGGGMENRRLYSDDLYSQRGRGSAGFR